MMPDALDPGDVEALLKAVDSGQVDVGRASADGQSDVVVYDFRRPERVSKEHVRSLEGLHEGFARTFGASLSTLMRTIVDVHVASIEQCTYAEFIQMLPNPTCLYLVDVSPTDAGLIVELNPNIVFPMLDRMLGGGRETTVIPTRPVTEIEARLVRRLVDRALSALAETWEPIQKVEFTVNQTETNPPMVQALPAGEIVVLLAIEIKVGDHTGTMNLCLPFAVVEPLTTRLSRASRLDYERRGPRQQFDEQLAHAIDHAPLDMIAYLAETVITVGDLWGLRVGDIIRTEKPAEATLLITVQGRPKFRGRPAEHRNKKAVLITDHAGPRDLI